MEIHMNENDMIVSKTDMKGRITYGNEAFINISGYSEKELLHSPHNILRHDDMPKLIFQLLWERIKEKKPINAYVKNARKDGGYYWVFANVTASVDANNNVIGYYSVRRKPSTNGQKKIEALYKSLLKAEKQGGVSASMQLLTETLKKEGMEYDEFIVNLQK